VRCVRIVRGGVHGIAASRAGMPQWGNRKAAKVVRRRPSPPPTRRLRRRPRKQLKTPRRAKAVIPATVVVRVANGMVAISGMVASGTPVSGKISAKISATTVRSVTVIGRKTGHTSNVSSGASATRRLIRIRLSPSLRPSKRSLRLTPRSGARA
jgi:hypothetical protein